MVIHHFIMNQHGEISDCGKIRTFHITHTFSVMSGRLSEAINPLIYTVGCEKLRNEIKKVFGIKVQQPSQFKSPKTVASAVK